ncbi:lysine-specific demethylase JMJ30 [Diplogelasinospora grovesii]|uniref:Lysine-specific demethylase JMJ30 n=1 Tax=Diplogelasinospora grovesii TaxID=303347 RepID=A0AAN6SAC6_9PEZI|nr:lysine-specific demethylase JMJ30 [Diplogelasinospora grovesii]
MMLCKAIRCVVQPTRLAASWALKGPSRHLSTVTPIREVSGPISVNTFRQSAFEAARPLVVRRSGEVDEATSLPALHKWFTTKSDHGPEKGWITFSPYLTRYSAISLPCELIYHNSDRHGDSRLSDFSGWLSQSDEPLHKEFATLLNECIGSVPPESDTRLFRFDAPLALLMAGLNFNEHSSSLLQYEGRHVGQLYIAQAPLNTLPGELQEDVPTPELVRKAGKGDVYDSSIWFGLEPTYTPWHRDPNPNLFCQLCSSKAVRLLPPLRGEQVFFQVRAQLGGQRAGHSRLRGEEMMQGAERRAFLDAIWGPQAPGDMQETVVHPGDALFVPKGWWHSVKSVGDRGRLNGSVNWWFR